MPSMKERTSMHSLIAIKNKLFAIGAEKDFLEMYDSTSNAFVVIKHYPSYTSGMYSPYDWLTHAIGMGRKVLIFEFEASKVLCYDADKNEWSNESCCTATDGSNFFLKIPKLEI